MKEIVVTDTTLRPLQISISPKMNMCRKYYVVENAFDITKEIIQP